MSTATPSPVSYAVRDSVTMLRRNLKRFIRYPSLAVSVVIMPVMMLLLFNYAFGGALGNGIGGAAAGGGGKYIDYVAPGIILMAATSGAVSAAIGVCTDVTEGIVNRFRTMPVSRASFLTGHVIGCVIQTVLALAFVIAVALLVGFRPDASPVEWLAAAGLLVFLTLALTWLSAGMGLVAKTPESASNMPLPLTFLPFLGSAIVPTDSMPTGLRWFAEYQPFTPIIETLRDLLMAEPVGTELWLALAWSALIALSGYLWSKKLFNREFAR